MKQRALAGAAAVGVAAIIVVVALVAGGGGGGGPRALPVLGAAGGAAADEAATMSSPVGGGGGPGYDFTGDASGLAGAAVAWSVGREDGEARARALAGALGVGDITETAEQWTAEGPDGILTVDRQPGLPWYYSASLTGDGSTATSISPDVAVSSDGSGAGGVETCTGPTEPTLRCPPTACDTGTEPAGCTDPGSDGDSSSGCPDGTTSCDAGAAPVGGAACSQGDPGCPGPVPAEGEAPAIDCAMPECPPGSSCIQVCPEPVPGESVEPLPVPEPQRPADLRSAEEAEAIARDTLTAAGISLDGARTRVDDGFSTWVFVADPVVGGLPTFGMTTAVGVGGGGVVEFANGWLADPHVGDTYDLVGVDVALDRLAETGGWFAYSPEPAACEACDEPALPEPMALDSVEVGLQLVPAYGVEEAWLVPSYLFTIAGGGPGAVVAAIAIADEHLVEPDVDPDLIAPVEPMPVEPDEGAGAGSPPDAGTTDELLCTEATGTGEVPLVATLCVSDSSPVVGQEVLVTISASDGDADPRDDCGSPTVAFGDEGGAIAVCDIGCLPAGEPTAGGATERTVAHTYDAPGSYELRAAVESGCGGEWGERLELSATVVVG